MTRDEIEKALKDNASKQIIWMWNFHEAKLFYMKGDIKDEENLDECNKMNHALERESVDLQFMLIELDVENE